MNDKKKNNIKFTILAVITIIILCFAITPKTLQNDTFYTIRIGELISKNGIDMMDHFSWHENLPYTYPHWAYDVMIYQIFNLGEMTGINNGGMLFLYISTFVFTSILGLLVYFTLKKLTKNNLISYILTLFTLYLMKDFIAARAQLITFIMFVLTIMFIESYLETSKKRYLIGLIVISIIIANIHVAVWPFFFVLFMPYIAEYIIASIAQVNIVEKFKVLNQKDIIKSLEKKLKKQTDNAKIEKIKQEIENAENKLQEYEKQYELAKQKQQKLRNNPYKIKVKKNDAVLILIIVMLICIFTGLLTPLKYTPYTYLIKTMKGNTTASISEHLPLTLYNDKPVMIVLALFLAILIFTDTKIKLSDLFMTFGLIFLSFMSRRQTSLMQLIGVFVFGKMVCSLINKYDEQGCEQVEKFMTSIIGKICTICFIIIVSFAIYKPKMKANYISESSYPVEAAKWMKENLNISEIKLFNEYNYGSYLLYEGIPVFIDSRADLYAPEFNGKLNEDGKFEGRDIFSDYINVSSISTYYETKLEEYGITHVIIRKNSKLNMFLSRDVSYNELYSDDNFVIYEREK